MKAEKLKTSNIQAYDSGEGDLAHADIGQHDFLQSTFHITPKQNEIFVDIGCGNGMHLMAVPCRRIGIDLSIRNLEEASEALPDAHFLLGDALSIPLATGSVNYVLLAAVLHHLPSWRQGLEEAVRVLAPGGSLIILEANRGGLLPLLPVILPFNWIRMLTGTYPWHERYAGTIYARDMLTHLNKLGMRIVQWKGGGTAFSMAATGLEKRLPGHPLTRILLKFLRAWDAGLGQGLPPHGKVYQFIQVRKG